MLTEYRLALNYFAKAIPTVFMYKLYPTKTLGHSLIFPTNSLSLLPNENTQEIHIQFFESFQSQYLTRILKNPFYIYNV